MIISNKEHFIGTIIEWEDDSPFDQNRPVNRRISHSDCGKIIDICNSISKNEILFFFGQKFEWRIEISMILRAKRRELVAHTSIIGGYSTFSGAAAEFVNKEIISMGRGVNPCKFETFKFKAQIISSSPLPLEELDVDEQIASLLCDR